MSLQCFLFPEIFEFEEFLESLMGNMDDYGIYGTMLWVLEAFRSLRMKNAATYLVQLPASTDFRILRIS